MSVRAADSADSDSESELGRCRQIRASQASPSISRPSSSQQGQRHGRRPAHRLRRLCRHAGRAPQGLGRRAAERASGRGQEPAPRGQHVLRGLFQVRRQAGGRQGRWQEQFRRQGRCRQAGGEIPARAADHLHLSTAVPARPRVWLHMGALGPKRVVTADDTHTPAAPYPLVNNDYSLLDASDLVFIDAPGTGFSRIAGKDREKAFYGVDPGRAGVRQLHRAVPVQVRPLEFAEVSVRRELRHHALGGADQRARDRASSSTSTA